MEDAGAGVIRDGGRGAGVIRVGGRRGNQVWRTQGLSGMEDAGAEVIRDGGRGGRGNQGLRTQG